MLSHTYTLHVCTHIGIQYTHKQVKQFGAGSITPSRHPLSFETRETRRGKERTVGVGGGEASDYLSLSMSISVGPFPPSAVPLSPPASHTSPPPHVILICAAKYTLPALLPLWQLKTKVELLKNVDLKQINTQCSAATAVLIKLDFLLEFTALFVHVCVSTGRLFSILNRCQTQFYST